MRFWDASAVVPLVIGAERDPVAESVYSPEPMVVWWGTVVEATSALARRERAGQLDAAAVSRSLGLLEIMASAWREVPPSDALRRAARRLLHVHPLRAADSLQLAAALSLTDGGNLGTIEFVCLDERLRQAAAREGLRLLPN